ncbi:carbon catabolite derepressing protein kinase [Pavlovales sp. CCMP2436]|nr:carbon catabolite derepressing protein kinase [Pavlovales sp. CCMP2436]
MPPPKKKPVEREHTTSIGNYLLSKTIGEGTFGKVKVGVHILTGERVAVKVLEKDRIVDKGDVKRVSREIQILKHIQHPNVIHLLEVIEKPRHLYLVTEHINGGELFDYIVRHGRLNEDVGCRLFRQIVLAVDACHAMNVIHRDLKPENMMVDDDLNLKLIDFGLSNTTEGELLQTACGSPCYAAPEMIAGKRYNGPAADIWSLGVCLFAMLCGYLPFEDGHTPTLYRKILNGEFTLPDFISDNAKALVYTNT